MQINIITREEIETMFQAHLKDILVLLNRGEVLNTSGKLYNNKDACEYLKVCPKTLQNYRDSGALHFIQRGRKIYYTQADLNNFLENNKKHF